MMKLMRIPKMLKPVFLVINVISHLMLKVALQDMLKRLMDVSVINVILLLQIKCILNCIIEHLIRKTYRMILMLQKRESQQMLFPKK